MSHPPALQLIPLASIHPSPYQYRTQFDDAKQQQLIESLRATGLSTPVLVRPLSTPQAQSGQDGTETGYELVSGERRWRAARELSRHQHHGKGCWVQTAHATAMQFDPRGDC